MTAPCALRVAFVLRSLADRIVTKKKPQAGCRLGLLSCRLNLGFWAGRQGVGGWGAAQLNPARDGMTPRPIAHVLVITKNTNQ
jgi:hypothetical protein